MTKIRSLSDTKNGQKASRWGMLIWYLWITISYYWEYAVRCTAEQKALLIEYIELYLDLLYCKFCRESMQDFWFLNNLYSYLSYSQKRTVFDWVLWLHGQVNAKLYKPDYPRTQAMKSYVQVETKYWDENEVSLRWRFCYWSSLYLLAANYPSVVSKKDEWHLKVQKSAVRLIAILPVLIPGSNFRDLVTANAQTPVPVFKSRQQLFHYVYNWETAASTTGKSLFGESIEHVATYFETYYRAS